MRDRDWRCAIQQSICAALVHVPHPDLREGHCAKTNSAKGQQIRKIVKMEVLKQR